MPEHSPAEGKAFGHYRIEGQLGAGGMGVVYSAYDTVLERKVAIKVVGDRVLADKTARDLLLHEARAASALNHPNICTIHEVGESDGKTYIVMEQVEGQPLSSLVGTNGVSPDLVVRYGMQIADALAHAHEHGVIHRDLKSTNVVVTPESRAKVLDFGLAARLKDTELQDAVSAKIPLTESRMIVGTLPYLAPELLRGEPADTRTDIWALGILLYEMATGTHPFRGRTAFELSSSILRDAPTSLLEKVPSKLSTVILRCLEKSPADRYQSANELRKNLALSERETGSDRTGTLLAFRATRRPKQWIWFGALIIAVAGIFWGSSRWLAPRPVLFQKSEIALLTASGKVTRAAISPDGKYVAYVTGEGIRLGKQTLWVRQVGTGSDVQILPPAEVQYSGLTFSREGDFLYAVRSEISNRFDSLYKVPMLGGSAKRLIADVENKVALSPDGRQLAFVRNPQTPNESVLMVANEDGSGERQIAVSKAPNLFMYLAWSPDGKTIVASTWNSEPGNHASPIEIEVESGAKSPLTQIHWAELGELEWVSDGRGLIVNSLDQPGGGLQIAYLSYTNGEVRRITNDLNNYIGISLTADSRTMATVQTANYSESWVALIADPDSANPITSDGRTASPAWSPDGKIVCTKHTGRDGNIWVMDSDGRNAKQLTFRTDGINYGARVSPDGRYVVFASEPSYHIWKVDSDGSNLKQLTDNPLDSSDPPDLSPDGKWVVYAKFEAEKGIWKIPAEGGASIRLNDAQAGQPAVSPDGRWIAYSYRDEKAIPTHGVAIMSFEGGPTTKRFDLPRPFRWDADSASLLYTRNEGGVENIWRQPIAGGRPTQLTRFKSDLIPGFDISRDGKRLVLQRERITSDAVLIRDVK